MPVDYSNPYVQDMMQRQAQRNALILQMQQQQQAQAAQNELAREQSRRRSLEALQYYDPVVQAAPQEEPGFLTQVAQRGIPATLGMFTGAGALLSDILGAEGARDYLMEKTEALEAYGQRKAPRKEPELLETDFDLGRIGTWAKETLADTIPTLAAVAATAATGGLAGGALAAGGLRAGLGTAARAAGTRAGAAAGLYGGTGAMEGGSAYATDYRTHGPEGTSPFMDLAVGAVNAGLERFGMEGSILRKLTGNPVSKITEDVADKAFKRGFAKYLAASAAGAGKEGLQEAAQETTQIINENVQDGKALLSAGDVSRMFESFAAGALVGGPMGIIDKRMDSRNAKAAERAAAGAPVVSDTKAAQPVPRAPRTVEERWLGGTEQTLDDIDSYTQTSTQTIADMRKLYNDQIQDLNQQYRSLDDPASALNLGAAYGEQLDPKVKEQITKQAKAAQTKIAAQIAKLTLEQKTKIEEQEKIQAKQLTKFQTDLDKGIAKQLSSLQTYGQGAYTQSLEAIKDSNTQANRLQNALHEKIFQLDRDITSTKKLLEDPKVQVEDSFAMLDNVRAMQLEKSKAVKELASVRRAANDFKKYLKNNSSFTPSDIQALQTKLRNSTDINPAEFDKSLDSFLAEPEEQLDSALGGAGLAQRTLEPFAQTPSAALEATDFLSQAAPTVMPFEQTPDTFLQETPAMEAAPEVLPMPQPVAQPKKRKPKGSLLSEDTPYLGFGRAWLNAQRDAMAQATSETYSAEQQIVERVFDDIAPSLKMLPALKDNVFVVYDINDTALPSDIVGNPQFKDNFGLYYPDGRVFLFAGNLQATAEAAVQSSKAKKKRAVDTVRKELSVKKLVHEAVIHRGLRVLFNNAELNRFLALVDSSFRDTPLWNRLMSSTPNPTTEQRLTDAEEFVAKLAERQKIQSMLTEQDKTFWKKVKTFISLLLKKVGLGTISEDDITLVTRAAAGKLADEANINALRATSDRVLNSVIEGPEVSPRANAAREALNKSLTEDAKSFLSERGINPAKLKEVFVDAHQPIQAAVRDLNKRFPHRLTAFTNIYRNLERLPNQIATRLQDAEAQLVIPLMSKIAEQKKPGEDASIAFARAEDFTLALASIERNEVLYEGASGMSTEQAMQIVEEYDSPAMREIVQLLQQLHQYRLDIIKRDTLAPPGITEQWEAKYKYYMPMKSWEDIVMNIDPVWATNNSRKSLSTPTAQEKIVRRAIGREDMPASPIAHSVMQMYDVIHLAETVGVQRQLIQLTRDFKEATDVFEEVETLSPEATEEEVAEFKEKVGKKRVPTKEGGIKYVSKKTIIEGKGDEAVSCIDYDGNMVRIWVRDAPLRKALKSENIVHAGPILQFLGKSQRMLGKLYTSRNPLFWFLNPIRDALTASLNMTQVAYELKKHGVPSPTNLAIDIITKGLGTVWSKRGVRQALMDYSRTGKFNLEDYSGETRNLLQHMQSFRQFGGQSTFFSQSSLEVLNRDLIKLAQIKNPNTKAQKAKAVLEEMFTWMDNVSDSLENMTRYVAYASVVDALMKHGTITKEDGTVVPMRTDPYEVYARAASIALNLTVNFSRKGSWAPVFNSLYLFMSASIGGNARMLRTLFPIDKETGKYDLKRTGMFFALPALGYIAMSTLARALMPDDEDGINMYDKIPEHIKDGHFIIPNPFSKGDYIKIPIAYGFSSLWALARNIIDGAYLKAVGQPGPSLMKVMTRSVSKMFDDFSPLGQPEEGWSMFVPTVLRPMVQLQTNTNFAGNPIYPESTHLVRGEIPDSEKYWSTTNDAVKWLASFMNSVTGGSSTRSGFVDISPETIEHVLTAYLGGMGRIAMMTGARAVEAAQGKPVQVEQLPFISLFYKTPQNSDTSAIFTKLRLEAQTQINSVDEMLKSSTMSPEARAAVLRENRAGNSLRGYTNAINERINNIRHRQRHIENTDLSAAKKHEMIQELDKQRISLMKQYNKRASSAGITGAL